MRVLWLFLCSEKFVEFYFDSNGFINFVFNYEYNFNGAVAKYDSELQNSSTGDSVQESYDVPINNKTINILSQISINTTSPFNSIESAFELTLENTNTLNFNASSIDVPSDSFDYPFVLNNLNILIENEISSLFNNINANVNSINRTHTASEEFVFVEGVSSLLYTNNSNTTLNSVTLASGIIPSDIISIKHIEGTNYFGILTTNEFSIYEFSSNTFNEIAGLVPVPITNSRSSDNTNILSITNDVLNPATNTNYETIAVVPTNNTDLRIYQITYDNSGVPDEIVLIDDNVIDGIEFQSQSRYVSTDLVSAEFRPNTANPTGPNEEEYIIITTFENGPVTTTLPVSLSGSLTCLLEDSLVLTPSGYKKIQYLKNGDEIISGDNFDNDNKRTIKIKSISKTTTSNKSSLCKIPKGMFNNNEDVYMSGYHAIFDIKTKQFIRPIDMNNYSDLLVESEKDRIKYYHIELHDKVMDTFVVSGMVVEGDKQFHGYNYSYNERNNNKDFINLF